MFTWNAVNVFMIWYQTCWCLVVNQTLFEGCFCSFNAHYLHHSHQKSYRAVCSGKIKVALGFQPQLRIKLQCTWTAISEGIFLWAIHSKRSSNRWHFITKFKFQSTVFFRGLISSGSELLALLGPMAAHTTDIHPALHFRVLSTLWWPANQQDFPSLSCFFFQAFSSLGIISYYLPLPYYWNPLTMSRALSFLVMLFLNLKSK